MQRIMGFIDSGKQQGAKVHLGGERHGTKGFWIQPTIFTHTRPDMRIVQEEIFGPVCVIIRFEDEEDVLRQANDTLYGLAAAVFTKDVTRAVQVAHKLHAGTVWVNCTNSYYTNVPFGGYKQSGIGREQGEYCLSKWVSLFMTLWTLFNPHSAIPMSRLSKSTSAGASEGILSGRSALFANGRTIITCRALVHS